ncbi:MBL fold metallo-hydrolase [Deefgea piscis]|uniref:MBL fold metallo-hydrolase n=1 Tax=Deefgea piscis TaxID=2739061 RepID=A0A6M8SNK8_9NEIS|nr:MBL fold metallo-hydrolase [Deefgea piscis]QKJ66832.1 MBL fold metallo-hydrolase [Deefgea piscis]
MGISVQVLHANHGDCILISHQVDQATFNVLIDGGDTKTFKYGPRLKYNGHLCNILDQIKGRKEHIDLAILTHIDDDHIGGLLRAFEEQGYLQDMVKRVWFNSSKKITQYFDHSEISENNVYLRNISPETGIKKGKELELLLDEIECKREPIIISGQVLEVGPFTFKILSPNKANLEKLLCVWPCEGRTSETAGAQNDHSLSFEEILAVDDFCGDPSKTNGSSIGFIVEADEKAMLFLGDAHDKTIVESLQNLRYSREKKLHVDLVKISHHGSQYNTSPEFLAMIEAKNYLISTDGLHHGHPDKRTIARIINSNPNAVISFNYVRPIKSLLLPQEYDKFSDQLQLLTNRIKL